MYKSSASGNMIFKGAPVRFYRDPGTLCQTQWLVAKGVLVGKTPPPG